MLLNISNIYRYLNTIKANKAACTKKPKPIVTMFSRSFWIVALIKKQNNPTQLNNTISTGGIFSVSPVKTASIVGIVARCIRITAIQPIVSALTCGACSLTFLTQRSRLKRSDTPCLICCVFMLVLTCKKCAGQF